MPDQNPLVSIIIPTLNRAHLIGETLDSVIAQTYQNWECIVVDDGSTDNTEEVMAEYMARDSRFQYHHRPKDRLPGGNAARNYGFEVSSGKYIQWFDSDDIMLPDFIQKKQVAFTSNIEIVICTGYSVDENLGNRKLKEMPIINNLFKEYILRKSKIMLPSLMFEKMFLMNKSLFSESLTRGQENEFFSRLFFNLSKEKYKVIDEGFYLYRQHRNTKSFEDKNSYRSDYKKSIGQVSLLNLERGVQLGDTDIINYHYRIVIHYLFEALHVKDSKLVRYFLRRLLTVFKSFDKVFALQLLGWISIFNFGGRTIYKVEKKFKTKVFL